MKFPLGQIVATPGAVKPSPTLGKRLSFFSNGTSLAIGAKSMARTGRRMTRPSWTGLGCFRRIGP